MQTPNLSSRPSVAAPPTTGVELTGLSKSYGDVRAVRDVSLRIRPGETVALLGPNGAGKSTTLDLMLGLSHADGGEVRVFGRSPAKAIASGVIGAMLQTGALISDLTVRECLDMLGSLYPNPLAVDEVLTLAGLTDVAERRTQKLSGGQTQRVRFACALVSNPSLIVLDEPTVAMDVESRRQFWDAMRELAASGRTVVFATHYLEEADAYADRIVLMSRGRIVADGATTEIKARVGRRVIRCTLDGARPDELSALPGVASADIRGDAVMLSCSDADGALRALIARYPAAHDFEIVGAGLEEAFLELTTDHTTADSPEESRA